MAQILERGDLYFFYRPRVQPQGRRAAPSGVDEIQRLFLIMHPRRRRLYRLVVVGRKHLPAMDAGERLWAFVDQVKRSATALRRELGAARYGTRTRGVRERPAARPAGEGVYSLVRHGDHTHFAYALELPGTPGDVQRALRVEAEGSYIITIKNPRSGSPRRAGLPPAEKAELPRGQQQRFRGRRFTPADPPALLDHAGVELLLVAAQERPEEALKLDLEAEEESAASAEIFRDLHLQRGSVPLEPLFKGEWR